MGETIMNLNRNNKLTRMILGGVWIKHVGTGWIRARWRLGKRDKQWLRDENRVFYHRTLNSIRKIED